ncbi:MAG: hypothetical protein NTZ95_05830 [Candidatus Omnitrophica bacterium]|nr:hypothetical protein [Candidatus Omnitrophota bacterium]
MRILHTIIIILFLVQDISYALAPESVFSHRSELPAERIVAKIIEMAIEGNGTVEKGSILIKGIGAVLHHNDKWLKTSGISYEVFSDEILIRFPSGSVLRYFDPGNVGAIPGRTVESIGILSKQYLPAQVDEKTAGRLEMFLNTHTFPAQLNTDGTIYERTPYLILRDIFARLASRMGGLKGKRFLDVGAGDMRASLVASALYGMKATAAELEADISDKAAVLLEAARREEIPGSGDIDLEKNTDVAAINWKNFDAAFLFYTEPLEGKEAALFRKRLEDRVNEMSPDGVFAVLFTRTHLGFKKHIFSNIVKEGEPVPLDAPGVYKGLYYLQFYRPAIHSDADNGGERPEAPGDRGPISDSGVDNVRVIKGPPAEHEGAAPDGEMVIYSMGSEEGLRMQEGYVYMVVDTRGEGRVIATNVLNPDFEYSYISESQRRNCVMLQLNHIIGGIDVYQRGQAVGDHELERAKRVALKELAELKKELGGESVKRQSPAPDTGKEPEINVIMVDRAIMADFHDRSTKMKLRLCKMLRLMDKLAVVELSERIAIHAQIKAYYKDVRYLADSLLDIGLPEYVSIGMIHDLAQVSGSVGVISEKEIFDQVIAQDNVRDNEFFSIAYGGIQKMIRMVSLASRIHGTFVMVRTSWRNGWRIDLEKSAETTSAQEAPHSMPGVERDVVIPSKPNAVPAITASAPIRGSDIPDMAGGSKTPHLTLTGIVVPTQSDYVRVWTAVDDEGRRWYVKPSGGFEAVLYRVAQLAHVNIPNSFIVRAGDIGGENAYWEEINIRPEKMVLVTSDIKDSGRLKLCAGAGPQNSGFEELLVFITWLSGGDFHLDQNIYVSDKDGVRRYVMFDMESLCSDEIKFRISKKLATAETIDIERLENAFRAMEMITPEQVLSIADSLGYGNEEPKVKKLISFFSNNNRDVRKILYDALTDIGVAIRMPWTEIVKSKDSTPGVDGIGVDGMAQPFAIADSQCRNDFQARPIADNERILLSDSLFTDGTNSEELEGVLLALKSILNKPGSHIEILNEKDIMECVTNAGPNKPSKDKVAAILSQEDKANNRYWSDPGKAESISATVLFVDNKLTGANYLYLTGLIGFTRAVMAQDRDKVSMYYKLLTGDDIKGEVLKLLDIAGSRNTIPFALNLMLRFRPIEKMDPAKLDALRIIMEDFLISA